MLVRVVGLIGMVVVEVIRMREIKIDELKQLQIDILDAVHTFCKENSISYWLDCGTLLGAIRHKGYIPWDDDIDIGMLRDDYDMFCKTFNGRYANYEVVCIENKPDFYVPYAKIMDNRTILIEKEQTFAVNIDLFVYDNAPDNERAVKCMFDKRDFYRRVYPYTQKNNNSGNSNTSIIKRFAKVFLSMIPSGSIIKLMVKNSKKHSRKETLRIGNFTSYARNTCSKTAFLSFIDGDFEGKKFSIPVGYDMWLRSFYGNYMELPPEEERVSHHTFQAYYKSDFDACKENK